MKKLKERAAAALADHTNQPQDSSSHSDLLKQEMIEDVRPSNKEDCGRYDKGEAVEALIDQLPESVDAASHTHLFGPQNEELSLPLSIGNEGKGNVSATIAALAKYPIEFGDIDPCNRVPHQANFSPAQSIRQDEDNDRLSKANKAPEIDPEDYGSSGSAQGSPDQEKKNTPLPRAKEISDERNVGQPSKKSERSMPRMRNESASSYEEVLAASKADTRDAWLLKLLAKDLDRLELLQKELGPSDGEPETESFSENLMVSSMLSGATCSLKGESTEEFAKHLDLRMRAERTHLEHQRSVIEASVGKRLVVEEEALRIWRPHGHCSSTTR
ncbi:hypothetical protein HDK90DRAFT_228058 [Phyllosticta capitalensis]|uniref:Uncharacterized protein n=1 Tax=Phyllosticta capitalensis TaxID=121624 RepID=A0ABR1YUN1_9PEZI